MSRAAKRTTVRVLRAYPRICRVDSAWHHDQELTLGLSARRIERMRAPGGRFAESDGWVWYEAYTGKRL